MKNRFSSVTVKSLKDLQIDKLNLQSNKKGKIQKNLLIQNESQGKQQLKYQYSGDSITGVGLNKTFFSIKKSNMMMSNVSNKEKFNFIREKEFCKKNCGEKLFKNLDLNQRFYLKKNGFPEIHNKNCTFFRKKINSTKNESISSSFREKRKIKVEKDLTLLRLSLSIPTPNNNSKKIRSRSIDIPDSEVNLNYLKKTEKIITVKYKYFI